MGQQGRDTGHDQVRDSGSGAERRDRIAADPPERLFTTVLMALVALLVNSVSPSREEVRSHIERGRDPYFRSFLARCMERVRGWDRWPPPESRSDFPAPHIGSRGVSEQRLRRHHSPDDGSGHNPRGRCPQNSKILLPPSWHS